MLKILVDLSEPDNRTGDKLVIPKGIEDIPADRQPHVPRHLAREPPKHHVGDRQERVEKRQAVEEHRRPYGPNVAETLRFPVMVTVQDGSRMPEQAPSQLTKMERSPSGIADRFTTVPLAKVAEHVPPPQLIPPGLEVTWPLPARPFCTLTVRVKLCWIVYVALATALLVIPLAAPIALTVVVCATVIAPVYTGEAVVGVLPLVV